MLKKFFLWTLLPVLIIFGLGWLGYKNLQQRETITQGDVFVERLKSVSKLTTVEGHFSEVYNYKDFWKYDISPLRKKALVRVRATVSAGIDLEGMSISMDPDKKIIELGPIPEATIQMVDHELDYYDLTEGTFNSFETADHNKIQQECKALIRKAALKSNLIVTANKQLDEYLVAFRMLIEPNGWQLHILPNVKENAPQAVD